MNENANKRPQAGGATDEPPGPALSPSPHDELARPVYGLFGMPIDAVDLDEATRLVRQSITRRAPLLISTPNLNFLFNSARKEAFRRSLLASDLCLADGMPLVWLARLLGVPLRERVAGSDLFEALKRGPAEAPINVYLFGGDPTAAAQACAALNASASGLACAGFTCPGFGNIESMSTDAILDEINRSGADFLSVSLGAEKGQAWLLANNGRLDIPVRVHLGAVLNFQAGRVARAPRWLQRVGLEWLWRVKEEPALWRRYWNDGWRYLDLLVRRALPLAFALRGGGASDASPQLQGELSHSPERSTLRLAGHATAETIGSIMPLLAEALSLGRGLVIDLGRVETVDSRFIGLLLVAWKLNHGRGGVAAFRASRHVRRVFTLGGFEWLLDGTES